MKLEIIDGQHQTSWSVSGQLPMCCYGSAPTTQRFIFAIIEQLLENETPIVYATADRHRVRQLTTFLAVPGPIIRSVEPQVRDVDSLTSSLLITLWAKDPNEFQHHLRALPDWSQRTVILDGYEPIWSPATEKIIEGHHQLLIAGQGDMMTQSPVAWKSILALTDLPQASGYTRPRLPSYIAYNPLNQKQYIVRERHA